MANLDITSSMAPVITPGNCTCFACAVYDVTHHSRSGCSCDRVQIHPGTGDPFPLCVLSYQAVFNVPFKDHERFFTPERSLQRGGIEYLLKLSSKAKYMTLINYDVVAFETGESTVDKTKRVSREDHQEAVTIAKARKLAAKQRKQNNPDRITRRLAAEVRIIQ